MNNMESGSGVNPETEDQKVEEEFGQLQKIMSLLKDMGFQTTDYAISVETLRDPISASEFSLVMDEDNGIRASYTKRRGLRIWYTNGFEDPKNPKRQEVERRLHESGLI